jgi:hypothetical protein
MIYLPAEVMFAHFHNMLTLKDWANLSILSKEWNDVAAVYKEQIFKRNLKTLVSSTEANQLLNTYSTPTLIYHYYVTKELQRRTSYKNITHEVSANMLINAPQMCEETFIAKLVSNITHIRGHIHTVNNFKDSYLCTPGFAALLHQTYNQQTYTIITPEDCYKPIMKDNHHFNIIKILQTINVLHECILSVSGIPNQPKELRHTWLHLVMYYKKHVDSLGVYSVTELYRKMNILIMQSVTLLEVNDEVSESRLQILSEALIL